MVCNRVFLLPQTFKQKMSITVEFVLCTSVISVYIREFLRNTVKEFHHFLHATQFTVGKSDLE